MKKILLIGAGRSTPFFIKYFGAHHGAEFLLTIADLNIAVARDHCIYPNTLPMQLDIHNSDALGKAIDQTDLVVSMLPPQLHHHIAEWCVFRKKSLITASYQSKEIENLHQKALDAGIFILSEMGVDPGIDHMSAMQVIHQIKSKAGEIHAFESFTGGLPAPESENNPWKYKFTWNPRNVVLAGQGGAVKFIQEGQYKYIPYHKLFRRTEIIDIPGFGKFEGYANRDSLKYRKIYGLENIKTMYRGTLRRPGFCRAWNCFVELGMTDDSFELENSESMTARELLNTFLAYNPHDSVELKLRQYLKIDQDDNELWEKLEWLGLFSNFRPGITKASPARLLQALLEEKWKMEEDDRDMIVMWHLFKYKVAHEERSLISSMVCTGEDQKYTAMAKTVGLPMAIFARLFLQNKLSSEIKGCVLPLTPDIYDPVLRELKEFGIHFNEISVPRS